VHERDRGLVADGAVWSDFVVVLTPSLQLRPGVVKRHEPMSVQALCPELAVKTLDEGVIGRFAGPREVQCDAVLVSPEIKIAGDELRALGDPNRFRVADLPADHLQCSDHILAPIAEAGIDRR